MGSARFDARDASAIAWMYAGHCATRCGLKEHASKSSSRFGARVASLARRDGASKRGFTSSHDREVWWFRRGRKVSSLARRAASDASTRFVAAWRRAASILDCASAVRAGRAFALAVTSGLRVVHVLRVRCVLCLLDGVCLRHRHHSRQSPTPSTGCCPCDARWRARSTSTPSTRHQRNPCFQR